MRSSNDWRRILSSPVEDEKVDTYHLISSNNDNWMQQIKQVVGQKPLTPDHLTVYGRSINISRQADGVAVFDFDEICGQPLAAADYFSLASRYHTFIIDNVPALKIVQKNEARRMITLLDALYECRCRLLIRADALPEDLFFPDARGAVIEESAPADQEMFAEVFQDLSRPYRPNVSSYLNNERLSSVVEDSKSQALEPLNKSSHSLSDVKVAEANKADFTNTTAFTGEDERFAYKRAVSRLKEMTGSKSWWADASWLPLDRTSRPWESFEENASADIQRPENPFSRPDPLNSYKKILLDKNGNLDSPFRTRSDRPPKFGVQQFWAMAQWGPGHRIRDAVAKRWIKGTEVYKKD